RAGDVAMREGDAGEEMFVVIEGEFEVSSHGTAVRTLEAGDIFGELALLGSARRRATVVAKSDGVVVPVDRERFEYLVRYAPSFALTVLRSVSALLHDLSDRAVSNGIAPSDGRAIAETASQLEVFHDDASVRAYAAGDSILAAGESEGSMFVVIAGRVEIGRDPAGNVVTAGRGDVFGEMALCDSQSHAQGAKALTEARIVPIDVLRFRELVQNNPQFAIEVMRTMAERTQMRVDAFDA
ncbi:MAG: cyclic nucleotide-binding domain-containing protein, partial [Candidatus Eremiobacteraeota bacterium]|nr:cyclic nucleotide-binding domain-containing protein [Candidatus Eremiobacteraeota bacterium]